MKLHHTLSALALGLAALGASAQTIVGVSWSNFQEERWKTDEAAIKAQLEKMGAKYISADAGGSPEKQLADVMFRMILHVVSQINQWREGVFAFHPAPDNAFPIRFNVQEVVLDLMRLEDEKRQRKEPTG